MTIFAVLFRGAIDDLPVWAGTDRTKAEGFAREIAAYYSGSRDLDNDPGHPMVEHALEVMRLDMGTAIAVAIVEFLDGVPHVVQILPIH
jgi:hypothetical protein